MCIMRQLNHKNAPLIRWLMLGSVEFIASKFHNYFHYQRYTCKDYNKDNLASMIRYNSLFSILLLWINHQLKSFPGYGSCCIEKVHPYPRGHHNGYNMLTRWGKIYLDNEKANASCVYICFIYNNVMLDVVARYGHIDRCQCIHAWQI